MLSHVFSGTTVGLEGVLIEVEVDVANRGFPTFTIVGLPNKSIDEAKDRVRSAITQTSFEMPDSRITVNLAPADIPKTGAAFDLPIAVGVLAASGMVRKELLSSSVFVGELSLEGAVRKSVGVLSIVMMARKNGYQQVFVPEENTREALLVEGVTVYPVRTLGEVVLHLNGERLIEAAVPEESEIKEETTLQDFSSIIGQEQAKRALEIAAAGFHNIHLFGPPGTGKTLLSRAFPSILPPLTQEESLEVMQIHSVAGLLKHELIRERPFRSPHHTTSRIGLIGGSTTPTPGEISLAHRGVLFLDEFPEFPRSVVEALRQPIEDGMVTISRAQGSVTFPSRFQLLAASNPCPCGYAGHPKKQCSCMPGSIARYKKRLSGPMLDRIDLHVPVPYIAEERVLTQRSTESSSLIRERVVRVRKLQEERFKDLPIQTNSEMSTNDVKKFCSLAPDAETLLSEAAQRLALSMRSFIKTLKVARTIADLDQQEVLQLAHVAEALQYRRPE